MKILFRYDGGIGDNVLASPVIRQYKRETGNFIGWLCRDRCRRSQLHKYNPYIDELHFIPPARSANCPWRDHAMQAMDKVMEGGQYDEARFLHCVRGDHPPHKSPMLAACLNMKLEDPTTEFYYDKGTLKKYYRRTKLPKRYVFFNGRTQMAMKNLRLDIVRRYLREIGIHLPIISPDFSWDIKATPIAFAADVMLQAGCVILADSALYHIANALKKKVDVVYFRLGEGVYEANKPLHAVPSQRVIFDQLALVKSFKIKHRRRPKKRAAAKG